MATREVQLKANKRLKSGEGYFEMRIPGQGGNIKFFSRKTKSPEEIELCHDFVLLYNEVGVIGGKRKGAMKLKYPEYSRTLQLEPLRSDFDITKLLHKEEAMEIILRQAQAAAKNLPENLRRSTPFVGNPSPSNRSSSHQNVHSKPLVAKQDLPGLWIIQLNFQEISELSHRCNISYTYKVMERDILESMVAGINEDSGHINFPKLHPDDFTSSMACLKQLMTVDEKIPWTLEMAEQGYKSHDSRCLELRKLLEDHNFKVLGSSIEDGNETSGRQRANEDERFPPVPEDCPSEDQNECGVPVVDSEGYDVPESPLVDGWPFGTDTTTPLAEIGVSQCVGPHEFDKVADEDAVPWGAFTVDFPVCIDFRREEEDGSLLEVSNGSNPETPFSLWNFDDCVHLSNQQSSHEDPGWLIPP